MQIFICPLLTVRCPTLAHQWHNQIISFVVRKCQSFCLQTGECKCSVRIVTGLSRSYSVHTDEHGVHTRHSAGGVFYRICTHQLQSMHTARHEASCNSWHTFCRPDLMHPVDTDSSYPGVCPVKTAGWRRKTHTRKTGYGKRYQERGQGKSM